MFWLGLAIGILVASIVWFIKSMQVQNEYERVQDEYERIIERLRKR
jgi:hypothetical protein